MSDAAQSLNQMAHELQALMAQFRLTEEAATEAGEETKAVVTIENGRYEKASILVKNSAFAKTL